MAKSKDTKSSLKKSSKDSSKVLSAVKDGKVTKSAQTPQAKSKAAAKDIAGKQDKKSKKSKKEPTPEPSSESEDEEDSDDSDSEEEVPAPKAAAKGKANGAAKKVEPESSDDSSSEEEAAAPKANGTAKKAETSDDDSDDAATSDESDSSDGDDAAPAKTAAPKVNGAATKKAETDSDDSEDSDDSDAADSDDSDSSEEEEKKEAPSKKRKAEEEPAAAAKKSKVDDSNEEGSKTLFVGRLSWSVDDDWLLREFSELEAVSARVMSDRDTGRSKGMGYVDFETHAAAKKALEEKQGAEIDGRPINVDFATPRQSGGDAATPRGNKFGDKIGDPTDTLFVGNLSFDASNEVLQEGFAEYGTVTSVRIPTDQESGRIKGFGYVSFSSVDEAKAALEACQGTDILGRAVRLDYSQPRPQQSGGFGGRGGGGFGGRGGGDRGRGGRGRGGDRGRGGRGRGGDRGGRGGRGGSSYNRGGFGDFAGSKKSFD